MSDLKIFILIYLSGSLLSLISIFYLSYIQYEYNWSVDIKDICFMILFFMFSWIALILLLKVFLTSIYENNKDKKVLIVKKNKNERKK